MVYPRNDEWCCFVFAETRNKARARLVGHFDNNHEYIDFGARCVKKNVGGEPEVCDTDCARLESLGFKYSQDGDE
jgi:hypothetical protein